MNLYHLIVELLIDAIAVLLGIILIMQKTDNQPKFYWGVIATLIGFVFIWENIGWLIRRNENPVYEFTDILNIEKMLEWYVLASLVSLFPLASLRPGYLNRFRLTACLFPPAIITTVGVCYLCFNGSITPLDSIDQITANTDKVDIRLRLVIFLFTVITPLLYFIYPLLINKSQREVNRMMYYFIGFMFLLLGIYISFTLYINDFFFNGFGITAIAFSIFFSVQYLRIENPLSDYIETKADENRSDESPKTVTKTKSLPTLATPLYYTINTYLKDTHEYADSKYSIETLAEHLGKKDTEISLAIKSGGHSGFREYINHLRLEYFVYQVSQDPHRTVKELMNICGFTSRPTFYRIFSEEYDVTPTEYIDSQIN